MTSLRYTVLLSLVFMNYEIETVFTSATKLFQNFRKSPPFIGRSNASNILSNKKTLD